MGEAVTLRFRHVPPASLWNKAIFLLRAVPLRERFTVLSTAQLTYVVLGTALLTKTTATWTALALNLVVLFVVQWIVSARHMDRLVRVRRFHPHVRASWLKAWAS